MWWYLHWHWTEPNSVKTFSIRTTFKNWITFNFGKSVHYTKDQMARCVCAWMYACVCVCISILLCVFFAASFFIQFQVKQKASHTERHRVSSPTEIDKRKSKIALNGYNSRIQIATTTTTKITKKKKNREKTQDQPANDLNGITVYFDKFTIVPIEHEYWVLSVEWIKYQNK